MGTRTKTRGRGRRLRRGSESGAALVEFSVVLPLLAILVFGILEYGSLISQNLALSTSTRAGARVGAQEGNYLAADYDILQSVENSRGFMSLGSIQKVVVYKSADENGTVPQDCKNGTPVAGVCNVYSSASFAMDQDELIGSSQAASWPASTRVQGQDYLGVWVIAEHSWLTGLFSTKPTSVADSAVMRIEPATSKPWTPPGGVAGTTSTIPETTTSQKPTTTIKKPTTTMPATTTQKPGNTTSTTKKPTTTTQRPSTTTPKPTTSTTKKPTTTTQKPATTTTKKPATTTTKKPATTTTTQKGGGGYFGSF